MSIRNVRVPILYRYRGRIPIFYKYNGIGKKVNYYFETMAFEETTIYSLVRYSIIKRARKIAAATNSSLESISHRKTLN